MENIHSTIGQRIYDLRIEHDVQQGELSKAIGLHQSVLNRIEKGTRPARDTEIISISRYFNVCTDYLLGITQHKNHQPIDTTGASYNSDNIHDDTIEDTRQNQHTEASPPSKILDYALSAAKNSSSQAKETDSSSKTESKKVAKKSDGIKRADGRYVYFKNDTVPKFLVQKLEASGKEYQGEGELFHGYATDISSNMDQWGKPAVVAADFKIGSNANKANLTLDARSSSNAPLLLANYSGNGYPINFNAQVFDLTSNANISAKMTADADGTWSLGGNLDMKVSKMAGMDFEPAQINAIYKNALSKVSSLSVNFTVGYNSSGMFVKIENPEKIASQLVTPLVKALEDELSVIAKNASQKLTVLISEKTGIASEQINSFNLLEKDISSYQNQLKSKQAEFTSLLNKKEISSSATSSIIEKATGSSDAASKISNALNKLKR